MSPHLLDDLQFLHDLGLEVSAFNNSKSAASHHFYVVTKRGDYDEMYYDGELSEEDAKRLSPWMKIGKPSKGSHPYWYHIASLSGCGLPSAEVYTYIAGDGSDLDCTGVATNMFFEKDGHKYTNVYTKEESKIVKHPKDVSHLKSETRKKE